jgi:hypothetical protein
MGEVMSYTGVAVSAWAKIESDCEIEYTLCGETVEFNIGGFEGGFQLDATKLGLAKLIQATTAALRELEQR